MNLISDIKEKLGFDKNSYLIKKKPLKTYIFESLVLLHCSAQARTHVIDFLLNSLDLRVLFLKGLHWVLATGFDRVAQLLL